MSISMQNAVVDTRTRTIKGLLLDVDASGDDSLANELFDLVAKCMESVRIVCEIKMFSPSDSSGEDQE